MSFLRNCVSVRREKSIRNISVDYISECFLGFFVNVVYVYILDFMENIVFIFNLVVKVLFRGWFVRNFFFLVDLKN